MAYRGSFSNEDLTTILEEKILRMLDPSLWAPVSQAHINTIIHTHAKTMAAVGGYANDDEKLKNIIKKQVIAWDRRSNDKLPYSKQVQRAFDIAAEANPKYLNPMDSKAFVDVVSAHILADMAAGNGNASFQSSVYLTYLFAQLGDEGKLALSSHGEMRQRQANANAARNDARAAQIRRITRGKPQYTAFSKAHGTTRNYDSRELETMSQEDLDAVEAAVMGYRAVRDSKPQEAQTSTDSFGATINQAPPPKQTGYVLKHPDPLIDREPTKAELQQWFKTDVRKFRNLIYIGDSNQADSRASARITEILNGR
jgi:hypothetical protein